MIIAIFVGCEMIQDFIHSLVLYMNFYVFFGINISKIYTVCDTEFVGKQLKILNISVNMQARGLKLRLQHYSILASYLIFRCGIPQPR